MAYALGTGCAISSQASDFPPFKVGIATQIVSSSFDLTPQDPAHRSRNLKFRPAASQYAGLILGYRWLSGTIWFSVPAAREIREIEGTSKYRDYRLSFYTRRWGVEAAYNRFQGYLIENIPNLSSGAAGGQVYHTIPDLMSLGYGLSFLYAASPGNYSLPAAMDQSEIQKSSAGSLLYMLSFRQQTIESGGPWIPTEYRASYGSEGGLKRFEAMNIAAGAGYGFTWAPSAFFFSFMPAITIGYQGIEYEVESETRERSTAAGNIHFRIATGINSRRFFTTINFYVDRYTLATHQTEIGKAVMGTTFALGARF